MHATQLRELHAEIERLCATHHYEVGNPELVAPLAAVPADEALALIEIAAAAQQAIGIPSTHDLLTNAVARAMYDVLMRVERPDVGPPWQPAHRL